MAAAWTKAEWPAMYLVSLYPLSKVATTVDELLL